MKFAVIGATGYVGNAVVQELAARGHDVTAFARNTGKVFAAPNVRAVAADVTAAGFAEQLAGFDAVVSAFNPGWTNPDIGRDFRDGYAARDLLTELRGRNDLNWAFISPPICLGADGGHSEDRTGKYRLGQDDALMDGDAPAGISVADLAIAIADDVEQKAHLHQRFTVASV